MNQSDREILDTLIKYNKERLEILEKHYIKLNSEMGMVQGELVWIRRLLMAAVGLMVTGIGYLIFGG